MERILLQELMRASKQKRIQSTSTSPTISYVLRKGLQESRRWKNSKTSCSSRINGSRASETGNRSLEGDELHTLRNKATRNDFFICLDGGSKRPAQPTSPIVTPSVAVATDTTIQLISMQSINDEENPSHAMEKDSKNVPRVVAAASEALMATLSKMEQIS
eukprot:scaffold19_cov114-Cylindrotheca_fusiformis.AAC.39